MNAAPRPLPRLVLDTNVIYSRVLHELIGRLAREGRLFDIVWSDELLAEAKRVLIANKPVAEEVAERWIGYLRDAFPSGRTDLSTAPARVDLSALTRDADDQHVCALAIAAGAQLLVTVDDGFDRAALSEFGVVVVDPDGLLTPALDEQPEPCLATLQRQAAVWRGGGLSELLDAFGRAGATAFANKARNEIRFRRQRN